MSNSLNQNQQVPNNPNLGQPTPQPTMQNTTQTFPTSPKKKRSPWVWIVSIVVILFLLVGGGLAALWFFVGSGINQKTEESKQVLEDNYNTYTELTESTTQTLKDLEQDVAIDLSDMDPAAAAKEMEEQKSTAESAQKEYSQALESIQQGPTPQSEQYYQEVKTQIEQSKEIIDEVYTGFAAMKCALDVGVEIETASNSFISSFGAFNSVNQSTSNEEFKEVADKTAKDSNIVAKLIAKQGECLESSSEFFEQKDIEALKAQVVSFNQIAESLEEMQVAIDNEDEEAFNQAIQKMNDAGEGLEEDIHVDIEEKMLAKFDEYYDLTDKSKSSLEEMKTELGQQLDEEGRLFKF